MNYRELFINNDNVLLVRKELACLIGLNEAIVLNQINYWLERYSNDIEHFKDNRIWVYNTYDDWKENNFPFWSIPTIKRIFGSLESSGIVISGNYNKMTIDRTKWYTIDFEKLQKILENSRLYQNDTSKVSKRTNAKCQSEPSNTIEYTKNTTENTEKNNSRPADSDTSFSSGSEIDVDNDTEILQCVDEILNSTCDDKNIRQTVHNTISHYLEKYFRHRGHHHPLITRSSMMIIIGTMLLPLEEENFDSDGIFYDDGYLEMIDRHFKTNYGIQVDYKLSHFATRGIILYQARNCGYFDGLDDSEI